MSNKPDYYENALTIIAETIAEEIYDFDGKGNHSNLREALNKLNLEKRILKVIRGYRAEEKEES